MEHQPCSTGDRLSPTLRKSRVRRIDPRRRELDCEGHQRRPATVLRRATQPETGGIKAAQGDFSSDSHAYSTGRSSGGRSARSESKGIMATLIADPSEQLKLVACIVEGEMDQNAHRGVRGNSGG